MSVRTVCTAIPYVNGQVHIGNLVTNLSGDVTARYLRMRGETVFHQAGTDENGLKILEAAENAGKDPHVFVRELSDRFEETLAAMHVTYDGFVRTTSPAHVRASQEVFRRLRDAGHVYLDKYEGWYDVSTETFHREEELVDGKSPAGNPVRWVSEDNWFFRLSAFTDAIRGHIDANPGFIVPDNRRNETLAFLKDGLRDLCISRANPGWGIPVPDDEGKVIYVWFDAVINYLTATGFPDAPDWETRWPSAVQWVGKDILVRFHATLWPAILLGLGLPLPETTAGHAWVMFGNAKLSKSTGHVVRPVPLRDEFAARAGIDPELAADVVRHFLTATMGFENDSNYTPEEFERRYNADLANDLGNCLNRAVSMTHRYLGGVVPDGEIEPAVAEAIARAKGEYVAAMDGYRIDRAVEAALGLVRWLGKYTDERAPWTLAKTEDPTLGAVLKGMLAVVRAAEGLFRPTMPVAADRIAAALGLPPTVSIDRIGDLPSGTVLPAPVPLFPRLEKAKPAMETPAPKPAPVETPKPAEGTVSVIDIAEFAKVKLRVGRVFEAEPLEGSDKLLKLQVHVGEERRQIVAGIRKSYAPEDLIGRQVVVVFNLKPAKLRGAESQGMLLAATDTDGSAILLQPDRETPEGAEVR